MIKQKSCGFLFTIFLSSVSGWTQVVPRHVVDSLQSRLDSLLANSIDRAQILIGLSRSVVFSNPPKAMMYLQEVLKIGEKSDNKKVIAEALHNMGIVNWTLGKLAVSLDYLQRSLVIAEEIDEKALVLRNINGKAIIYADAGRYEIALNLQRQTLQYIDPVDSAQKGFYYVNLADILLELSEYDSAKILMLKANQIRGSSPRYVGLDYYRLARSYFALGEYEAAIDKASYALSISEQENDPRGVMLNASLLAEINLMNDNGGGSGLGLSIVKKILDKLQCKIWITDSELGAPASILPGQKASYKNQPKSKV